MFTFAAPLVPTTSTTIKEIMNVKSFPIYNMFMIIILQYHPTATDLSNLHRQIWKPSDVKRMEKIILDKLDWNLYPCVTTLAYLQVIYSMLALISTEFDDDFLQILVERSELYINYTRCAQYSVSIHLKHSSLSCIYRLTNSRIQCSFHTLIK